MYIYVCLHEFMYIMCTQVPTKFKSALDSLDLELQAVVSHLFWALETKPIVLKEL